MIDISLALAFESKKKQKTNSKYIHGVGRKICKVTNENCFIILQIQLKYCIK